MKKKHKLDPYLQKILDTRDKRLNAPPCKPGTHKLHVTATCGDKAKIINCKVCSLCLDVPLNARERMMMKANHKKQEKETKILHGLAWKYQKEFYHYDEVHLDDIQWKAEQKRVNNLNKVSKRKLFKAHRVHKTHNGFKWTGYELMQRFDKFAKKHPEVTICGCDDSYHACSYICLIPHRTDSQLWGTTVVIVPQMGPFPPTEIFLYPGHSEGLIEALTSIVKEAKVKAKSEGKRSYCPDASIPKGFTAEGL